MISKRGHIIPFGDLDQNMKTYFLSIPPKVQTTKYILKQYLQHDSFLKGIFLVGLLMAY